MCWHRLGSDVGNPYSDPCGRPGKALLPLQGACPEPLALSDSEWGSERVETCPERSEWRERVRQASGAKKILFQNETYLKQISLMQPLKLAKTVEC
jgi:hypothetical protein